MCWLWFDFTTIYEYFTEYMLNKSNNRVNRSRLGKPSVNPRSSLGVYFFGYDTSAEYKKKKAGKPPARIYLSPNSP